MPVQIYTDERVPVAVAAGLQRRHVAAISARDAGNLGLTDEEQFAYATLHHMVIFTHDTDFLRLASIRAESGEDHWGIVYAHQNKVTIGDCIHRLKEIADLLAPEDLRNHIEFL